MNRATSFLAGVVCLVACLATHSVLAQPTMSVTRIASGLSRPVFATTAPGDATRLFIVEQHTGIIKILNLTTGQINTTPFLTIEGLATGNEQGLLGLAFHPMYQNNGRFYVNCNTSADDGDTHIREYTRSTADLANPKSARELMTINQPFPNHNGGWMGFGPTDQLLYIATGDGGSGGDPQNNAQTITNNLLGKILRIDPLETKTSPYSIPATNPFVGVTGDDEIWAYGLRNPWRCCFDWTTSDLYIADVGEGTREEINVQPSSNIGGTNYGWRVREGTLGSPLAGAIDPVYDYEHGFGALEGYSVTGGCVYRGPIAALRGHYFFSDYVTDGIWSFRWDGSAPSSHNGTNYSNFIDWTDKITANIGSVANVSSFAEDALGNVYILDLGGEIFRIDGAVIPLTPMARKIGDGVFTGGQLADLFESDDSYLLVDPEPTQNPIKQQIDIIVQAIGNTATPGELSFRLECKKIGGPVGDVIQSIELFNYVTNEFEFIDIRPSENIDTPVEITIADNVTRFVNPATREITAYLKWRSQSFSGDPFTWSIEVDEAVWPVAD
ncbi:MAG: PQQ-dependent sugar dehydrogenase [Pirellulaceae bacterium]